MQGIPHPQYAAAPPLTAPRAQPPPSAIPTDRLADQASRWAPGQVNSPGPPTPGPHSIHARLSPQSQSPGMYPQQGVQLRDGPVPSQQRQYAGPSGSSAYAAPTPNSANSNSGLQSGWPTSPGYNDQRVSGYSTYSNNGSMASSSHSQPSPAETYSTGQTTLPGTSYSQSGHGYQPGSGYQQQYSGPPQPPVQPLHAQPSGYAQPYSSPTPHQQQYYQPQPPPPGQYTSPTSNAKAQHPSRGYSEAANSNLSFDQLSLNDSRGAPSTASSAATARRPLYANPLDGPPHKLSVTHPDRDMLASMREASLANPDPARKVAWAKQVLKFIERNQAGQGESSRINDPILVRWTDEALNHVLASASSPTPVPLALYLRGDLSSTGSFPSYRAKDPKSAFRDFEAAANAGYHKAWFRIGRAYEDFADVRRAVGAYEKGVEKGDCGSMYRLAMAYLLGQIGIPTDPAKGVQLLTRAADVADLDTPQPPYILGMVLAGEFNSPTPLKPDPDEARARFERSAYLSFGPACYKMGFNYEYAALGCAFDPLLSVAYYALASQAGEVEADMSLSKWYLCGVEGGFDKDEKLAYTFADKAAARGLPSAEFAVGYYHEVGISVPVDVDLAQYWYTRAAAHGNQDAKDRLAALAASASSRMSRTDHEAHIDTRLVRKRTQAKNRSDQRVQQQQQQVGPGGQFGQGGRVGGQPGYAEQTSVKRRDTIRQVEMAAGMGGGRGRGGRGNGPGRGEGSEGSHGSHGSRPGGGGALAAQQVKQQYAAQAEAARRPSPQGPRPGPSGGGGGPTGGGAGRKSPAVRPQASRPPEQQTFADLGIKTTKAKKDDCLVM